MARYVLKLRLWLKVRERVLVGGEGGGYTLVQAAATEIRSTHTCTELRAHTHIQNSTVFIDSFICCMAIRKEVQRA